ncbi:MAG TPA: hypothetical protein VFR97_03540 [Capillimicrobium sp.]|nr:hypothetical protein [Capillimicrobium sp.]
MTADVVDAYLSEIEAETRRVADAEWGLSAPDVGGWPLHVGLRLHQDVLRAQAEVVGPDQVDAHEVLYRNRSLVLVRYAHTGAGAVWVVGDLPQSAVTPRELDRLLGLLVSAAADLRRLVAAGVPVRSF